MKNIVLCGMMGSGKSTMARRLGQQFGREVVDTDELAAQRAGRSISQMFDQQGEAAFRQLETDLCLELAERSNLIIATGGGLPLRRENREALRKTGLVVFLNRPPEEIYDSVDLSARPLAQQGKAAFLERFSQREPIYRAFSDVIIEDFSTPERTLAEILRKLEGQL